MRFDQDIVVHQEEAEKWNHVIPRRVSRLVRRMKHLYDPREGHELTWRSNPAEGHGQVDSHKMGEDTPCFLILIVCFARQIQVGGEESRCCCL